jgi:hypothetical protein
MGKNSRDYQLRQAAFLCHHTGGFLGVLPDGNHFPAYQNAGDIINKQANQPDRDAQT